MTIEVILAEFGPTRNNAGDASLPGDRLEPSFTSFRKHFPEAQFTVYTDQPWESTPEYQVVRVNPPFHRHQRWGHRANDYYKGWGLLKSTADIAIAIDSDMLIVNDKVRTLLPLTERFGMCMPSNARRLVWRDAASTCDGGLVGDQTEGMGMCRCTALWALRTMYGRGRELVEAYCAQVVSDAREERGARGPLSLWRAEWATGIAPYALPGEWCVTGSTLGDLQKNGRTIPVILHAGHKAVVEHYRGLIG